MELKDLMAISGYPGLYRFISQGKNAIIVESLEDKKRMSAYSTSKISTLEEIAVFTETGEMALADVLKRIYDHSGGKEVLSHKSSNQQLKSFFQEVLPEYDRDRVYVSDMKKIINWYNLLLKHDIIRPDEEEKGDGDDTANDDEVAGEKKGQDDTANDDAEADKKKGKDDTGNDDAEAGEKDKD